MAKLYFYYSAMNAGKSTTLLQSSYNYQERGMNTLLFTPQIDNRTSTTEIHSRIGISAEAISFTADDNLYHLTKEQLEQEQIHCVLIDEAQFLSKDQVFQLTEITDKLNIPVLSYGLRSDFLGEPFVGSQYLLAWADVLNEIKTVCHCGRKASMVIRLDEHGNPVKKGAQVEIGGNDKYISMCRKHFKAAIYGEADT
ncbi:thymidine kinase [Piscirickettsia litoralis]|uniref:Thymidine kinase n=1 Tax=Piscirickettsia litoralis TaxID=1891921 RepID=A0ABX3A5I6_9GAMM|nr:thymidine kinase [Piscirickettsia litoralis]ODN42908.1 thymidine kinase [Piscirickettsia litoralis]